MAVGCGVTCLEGLEVGEKLLFSVCVCVCVCVCVFTHMHACRQGRGGLCVGRAPVRAGIPPGFLSEGGAGRLAGRVGPQLCQPVHGVTQARSRK